MHLAPMRFKDYTWPHNPETYTVEFRRRVAAHKIPFGGCVFQDLGETHRVMRGEGTFAGEGAYEEFQALSRVFYQAGPGLLTHPVWRTAEAHFVALRLAEEPRPDYVRYTFEFWETPGTAPTALTETAASGAENPEAPQPGTRPEVTDYIVRKGDTLWGIAKRYDVALAALIAANPQVKNPNLIYPGDRVRIP